MRLTWCGHVLWYIQYLWREAEWIEYGRENNEEHGKDCVEEEFQWARVKLGKYGEGAMEV